ncbi:MAG: DUF3592 domain-containing protein [Planctomycetota bacterium]
MRKTTGLFTRIMTGIIVAVVLSALFVVFSWFFLKDAFLQNYRSATYKPVKAVVLSTDILLRSLSRSDPDEETEYYLGYEPVVKYQYEINSNKFANTDIYPIQRIFENRKHAEAVNGLYQRGEEIEAFYDPKNPSKSFLIKRYSYVPYLIVQLSFIFISILFSIIVGDESRILPTKKPIKQISGSFVGYRIKATSSIARRFLYLGIVFFWLGIAFAPSLHYVFGVEAPNEIISYIILGIFIIIFFVLLVIALIFVVDLIHFVEAKLIVSTDTFSPGRDVLVNVSQRLKKTLLVKEAKISLVCEKVKKVDDPKKSAGYEYERIYEKSQTPVKDRNFKAYEVFGFDWEVTIPGDKKSSTKPGTKKFPKYNWFFELLVKYEKQIEYNRKFPIFVQR